MKGKIFFAAKSAVRFFAHYNVGFPKPYIMAILLLGDNTFTFCKGDNIIFSIFFPLNRDAVGQKGLQIFRCIDSFIDSVHSSLLYLA